jgi:beta-N-acetylhexosaminidase
MHVSKQFVILALLICLIFTLPAAGSMRPVQAQADPVAALMSRMSIEDKVGQLFIVPFVGAEATPGSHVWQLITEYKVGGIILLAANSNFNNDESAPRQITELTNTLQTIAFNTNGLPVFVAVDHEGDGYPYSRITRGAAPIPSQMALGAAWDPTKAETVGQIIGQELSAMGINMLLGPGLDVLNDPRPTGRGDIGTRVFGGDPYWAGQLGRAYIRGVHTGSNGKMATVAKHFPGHGGSDRLPDNEVATVDKSLKELQRIELPPFFHATANLPDDPLGATDALMSSHIRYRGFQGDIRQFTTPISFDADGMKTLLTLPEIAAWRKNNGLIVSDALGVPAVRKHFDPDLQTFPHRRIAKDAFLAGNDVLSLVQFDLKSIWSDQFANIKDTIFFFRTEYINNPTFAGRVDASVERILRLKLKLYPNPGPDTLINDPNRALEITRQPHPVFNEIARDSLTLIYPSPEELRLRLPQAPSPDDNLLIVTDTRLARECFTDNCPTRDDLFIPRRALEETILRFYGPGGTGQIQPERVNSITFSELKMVLGGLITPETPTEDAPNPKIQLPAEEVRRLIQEADWLIFAAMDLNTSRYVDSDALKLFLAQESGSMRNKKTIVLAFNAPYYLDTTEITKLTAYYGLYSKTTPHIEMAARALFGETAFPGASPVTVEGIGYNLGDALSPDPDQDLSVKLAEAVADAALPPVTVQLQAGPVLDRNGHVVPDGTSIEFIARLNGRQIETELAQTRGGLAEATLTLNEAGELELFSQINPSLVSNRIQMRLAAPPSPTPTTAPNVPPPAVETPAEILPAPIETPTAAPLATDTPAGSPTATPESAPAVEPPAPPAPQITPPRRVDGLDFLSALSATLLAGLVGFWAGQHYHKPLSRRLRLGLWVLVAGLGVYLLFGLGLLRPDQWLGLEAAPLARRLSLAGLVFVTALAAAGLDSLNRAKNRAN